MTSFESSSPKVALRDQAKIISDSKLEYNKLLIEKQVTDELKQQNIIKGQIY